MSIDPDTPDHSSATMATTAADASANRAADGPRVLILDDDHVIAFLLARRLEDSGFQVTVTHACAEARAAVEDAPPDLALVDFYLDDETGLDFVNWLQERDPDCAVIMMSGDPSPHAAEATIRSPAFDYLSKPIDDAALIGRMRRAWELRLERRRRRLLADENRIMRERLTAVFDAVGEGLICVDGNLTIQEINRFARELFLTGEGPLLGSPLAQCWPTLPDAVRNALDVVLGAGRPVPNFLVTSASPPLMGKALIVQALPVTLPAAGPGGEPAQGALLCLRDVTRIKHLESVLRERHHYHGFIGRCRPMQELYDNLRLAANSDSTVLLMGESGTGKELAAAALHYESHRADRPFLRINCAALPESLLESELFGHTRGAFTGAIATRKGVFESAHGGTLFLDEIGDISPRLQTSLLRVIETKTFERIGDHRPQKVDVRLITATNCDLRDRVRSGAFREDLYYRLNVINIELPPLRSRGDDVALLADFFVARLAERLDRPAPRLAPETYDILMSYHWPGNVRQLENAIEQAVIFCREEVLMPEHLPRDIIESVGSASRPMAPPPPAPPALDNAPPASSKGGLEPAARRRRRVRRPELEAALAACHGNQSDAAARLGVNRSTIWRMMKRWGMQE